MVSRLVKLKRKQIGLTQGKEISKREDDDSAFFGQFANV